MKNWNTKRVDVYVIKINIPNCLQQLCFVLLQLVMFTKLAITLDVPNKDPFIHLRLYFINMFMVGGASVKAFASGTNASLYFSWILM